MLEKISSNVPEIAFSQPKVADKMTYSNDEGFEIFEVNDDEKPTSPVGGKPMGVPEIFDTKGENISKARPNDPCPCGSGKKYKKCCGVKV